MFVRRHQKNLYGEHDGSHNNGAVGNVEWRPMMRSNVKVQKIGYTPD